MGGSSKFIQNLCAFIEFLVEILLSEFVDPNCGLRNFIYRGVY